MIRGTIGDSATGPGVAVVIDIRGPNVIIRCGKDVWTRSASRVRVETLTPDTFRLVFGDEAFILRPADPLQVRLQFDHQLAAAARRRRWRRGKTPRPATSQTGESTPHRRWVRDDVEVEAVALADDSADLPAWPRSDTRNIALRR